MRSRSRSGLNYHDALIALEETLESNLNEAHSYVDGHDFGSGEMNLFIHTDRLLDAFRDARACLVVDQRWSDVRAAYRSAEGDQYTVVWPETLREFSVR